MGHERGGERSEPIVGARLPEGLRVAERPRAGTLRLTPWERAEPAIVCGITTAALGDYCVTEAPSARVDERYGALARSLGFGRVSVPSQVHGTEIRELPDRPGPASAEPRVERAGRVDGQVTGARGCLLAATAADCVPVYLWSPRAGRIGLVHAGWKGAASGILGRALSRVGRDSGGGAAGVQVHLGPAICGRCYEVDAPVLSAFGLPGARAHLDLRGLLAREALAAGVARTSVSVSRHCTACGPVPLHSHRASGGSAGRLAAFLGFRGD